MLENSTTVAIVPDNIDENELHNVNKLPNVKVINKLNQINQITSTVLLKLVNFIICIQWLTYS